MVNEFSLRVQRDELQAALESVTESHFAGRRQIKGWRRRYSRYSSSYPIENLHVELSRGGPLKMVFKDLSPATVLATARRVRPHFLYHPLREIETYRTTLNHLALGTAAYYGAITAPDSERYWLFLERVDGPLLWQVGRMDAWREAARWLATLHGEFELSRRPQVRKHLTHLRPHDEQFFSLWLQRAEKFFRHRRSTTSTQTRRRFRQLADRYDWLVQRLMQLPATLVHGEFYPSNVIVRGTERRRRICPIDWELAAIAPGMLDLAALTSGDWSADDQQTMIAAYRDAMDPGHGGRPSMAELSEAVDCCRLHLSIQLLGWASDWSPPKQHAQNWLRQAFRLADKLGL